MKKNIIFLKLNNLVIKKALTQFKAKLMYPMMLLNSLFVTNVIKKENKKIKNIINEGCLILEKKVFLRLICFIDEKTRPADKKKSPTLKIETKLLSEFKNSVV